MENGYIVESFSKMISAKLVIRAKEILKKSGFESIEFFFKVNIRDGHYFQANVYCNDYIYIVPEIDLYNDIVNNSLEDNVSAFVESYGSFLAYDYANSHGGKIEIDLVPLELKSETKSSNDTGKRVRGATKRDKPSN
jgi:hypothetical protein